MLEQWGSDLCEAKASGPTCVHAQRVRDTTSIAKSNIQNCFTCPVIQASHWALQFNISTKCVWGCCTQGSFSGVILPCLVCTGRSCPCDSFPACYAAWLVASKLSWTKCRVVCCVVLSCRMYTPCYVYKFRWLCQGFSSGIIALHDDSVFCQLPNWSLLFTFEQLNCRHSVKFAWLELVIC